MSISARGIEADGKRIKPAEIFSPPESNPVETIDPGWSDEIFVTQRRGDWCWAACCEMASAAMRKRRSQEQFVEALFGEGLNPAEAQSATDLEIVKVLAGRMDAPKEKESTRDRSRQKYLVIETGNLLGAAVEWMRISAPNSIAVDELRAKRPVILGLRDWNGMEAHAVFVTSMEVEPYSDALADASDKFFKDLLGKDRLPKARSRYRIRSLTFFDPLHGFEGSEERSDGSRSDGMVVLDAEEIERHGRFLLSPKMAEAIYEHLDEAIYETNRKVRR